MYISGTKVLSIPYSIIYVFIVSALITFSTERVVNVAQKTNLEKPTEHSISLLSKLVNTSPCVVELFTSEGCSSCPPADKLVAAAQNEFKENAIILSYHVDYWDRLGWKDPFSKRAYSERQRQYAQHFKLESVYTPQAIVNGKTEFVGSNKSALWNEISSYKNSGNSTIETETVLVNNKQLLVNYHYNALKPNENVVLELVLKYASTQVNRGENSGVTLQHINIVQDIEQTDKSQGTATFKLPVNFKKENYLVVVFIQNKSSLEITNAKKVTII